MPELKKLKQMLPLPPRPKKPKRNKPLVMKRKISQPVEVSSRVQNPKGRALIRKIKSRK